MFSDRNIQRQRNQPRAGRNIVENISSNYMIKVGRLKTGLDGFVRNPLIFLRAREGFRRLARGARHRDCHQKYFLFLLRVSRIKTALPSFYSTKIHDHNNSRCSKAFLPAITVLTFSTPEFKCLSKISMKHRWAHSIFIVPIVINR